MTSDIILCVDDDATFLAAIRGLLVSTLGGGHVVEIAEGGQEALEICREFKEQGREISVAIADFIMPSMRGDELLVRLHRESPRTIKIMLTGQSDLNGVKRAINEANLYRFLEKPFHNTDFILTARSALQAYQQAIELEQRNRELERINKDLERIVEERTAELVEKNRLLEVLSASDRLTGLCNRLRLDQVLEQELSRSRRSGSVFSLVLLDVDHFKAVNDTHGHQVGDRVLVAVAKILSSGTREVDTVGRWGGEEFLVICPGTDGAQAQRLAENLRRAIEAHSFPVVGQKTSSFGVASLRSSDSIEALIARADAALYRSKAAGRNRIELAV